MALDAHHHQIGGGYRPLAEINVTPLVDVMLVLLVIFMVTAPLLSVGLKVNLPQAKQSAPLDPKEPVILTIAKDGTLSLGSDPIAKDQLVAAVEAKLAGDTTSVIHLRGDKGVPFGDVVSVMDLLATNGLTHIAIITQPGDSAASPPSVHGGTTAPAPAGGMPSVPRVPQAGVAAAPTGSSAAGARLGPAVPAKR